MWLSWQHDWTQAAAQAEQQVRNEALMTYINQLSLSVFKKTCEATQKNVKSYVFWILKKNVKKAYR